MSTGDGAASETVTFCQQQRRNQCWWRGYGGVRNSGVGECAVAVVGINACQLSDGGRIRDGDIFASSNVGTSVGGEVARGVLNRCVGEGAVAVVGINGCQLSDGAALETVIASCQPQRRNQCWWRGCWRCQKQRCRSVPLPLSVSMLSAERWWPHQRR